jgi:hypothetical protein
MCSEKSKLRNDSFTKTGMNVVANYLKTLWGDRHFGRILQNKIIEKMKACVPNFF